MLIYTAFEERSTSMDAKPNPEFLRYAISGIRAEYEAEIRQAEQRRDKKIADFRNWWLVIMAPGGATADG